MKAARLKVSRLKATMKAKAMKAARLTTRIVDQGGANAAARLTRMTIVNRKRKKEIVSGRRTSWKELILLAR